MKMQHCILATHIFDIFSSRTSSDAKYSAERLHCHSLTGTIHHRFNFDPYWGCRPTHARLRVHIHKNGKRPLAPKTFLETHLMRALVSSVHNLGTTSPAVTTLAALQAAGVTHLTQLRTPPRRGWSALLWVR